MPTQFDDVDKDDQCTQSHTKHTVHVTLVIMKPTSEECQAEMPRVNLHDQKQGQSRISIGFTSLFGQCTPAVKRTPDCTPLNMSQNK